MTERLTDEEMLNLVVADLIDCIKSQKYQMARDIVKSVDRYLIKLVTDK